METLHIAREFASAAGEKLRNIHIFKALLSLPEGQRVELEPEEAGKALTAQLSFDRKASNQEPAQTPRTQRLLSSVYPHMPVNLLHGLLADAGNGEIAELLDRHRVTGFTVHAAGGRRSIPNTFVLEDSYMALDPETGDIRRRYRGGQQAGESN